MLTAVRIDTEAWSDLRFGALARHLGMAGHEHALIMVAKIWSWQTANFTWERPTYVVASWVIESVLGGGGADAMVRCELAEATPSGYRIRGTKGRIEWLCKLSAAGAKGRASKGAKRKANHNEVSDPGARATAHAPATLAPLSSGLLVPEDQILSRAVAPADPDPDPTHPEPQSQSPNPDPDPARAQRQQTRAEIWRELEAARGAVATDLGITYRKLPMFDHERELVALFLAERDVEIAAVHARHAIAVAREEALAKRSLEWFSGVIFGDKQLRRAAGMDPAKMRAARLAAATPSTASRPMRPKYDRPDDEPAGLAAHRAANAGGKP